MRISSRFCDLHPGCRLQPATNLNLSPLGDLNKIYTVRCPQPDCHRNYAPDFGYFDAAIGERPDFGDLSRKPRCGQNHSLACMVVTELDGSLLWACPVGECKTTQPYIRQVEGMGPIGA